MRAVKIPRGISPGSKVLASVSQMIMKIAPSKIVLIKVVFVSAPKITREKLGMINPTQLTTPETEMMIAVSSTAADNIR